MRPKTPIAWLWTQLETLLSEPTLDLLRKNYAEQQHRYELAAKIRAKHRLITERERWTQTPRIIKLQERARIQLQKLLDELNVIDNVS
jgi:hypothetical protein